MQSPADAQPAGSALPLTAVGPQPDASAPEFGRLWHGFMTARSTLGLMLLLFQAALYHLGLAADTLLVVICGAYFAAALTVRLSLPPRPLGPGLDPLRLATIGVDLLVFSSLQFLQGYLINYTPLYALPVLLAAVLGPLLPALGTAAGVTLLLLAQAAWLSASFPLDSAPLYIQAALTGTGCFVIAFLAHQLSARLASEELRSRRHQFAARVQQQVNQLVIESMSDGILVVDAWGTVHAANPAARHLLQADARPVQGGAFELGAEPGWQPLVELVRQSLQQKKAQYADVNLQHPGQGPCRLRARTRLTSHLEGDAARLCVVCLQDQREMEARLRTDKLASMGRMSVAVAHEIRNPLAAITQANALLEEDLGDPRHKQLTALVQQNAHRLEKIVEEILDISRTQYRPRQGGSPVLELNTAVSQICQDWAGQTRCEQVLQVHLCDASVEVEFDPEHLRRVLVNLLDNARRYASQQAGAMQVWIDSTAPGMATLRVWSDGPPMEPSVERHLFEPFFSSESRSSGLGLYICRELCEGHGALIGYQRCERTRQGGRTEGNEFFVSLRQARATAGDAGAKEMPFTRWL